MRKLLFPTFLLFFIVLNLNAQDNLSLTTEQIQILKNQLKNLNPNLYHLKSDGSLELKLGTFRGSPFENKEFTAGATIDKVNKTKLKAFIRYNMFSDEIEVKSNLYSKKAKALIKTSNLSCVINGTHYHYLNFTNENRAKKYGYLKLIFKGNKYNLYERLTSKYTPKEEDPDSSYRKPEPASFEKKVTYYLKHGNNISFLPTRKKLLYKNYSEMSNILKSYIKKTHPSLKNKSDLIGLVRFLDTKN